MARDDVRLLVGGPDEPEMQSAAAVEHDPEAEEIQDDDAGEDDQQTVEQETEKASEHEV